MVRDHVTSRDGTTIGYRQLGRGPGLLLLHGGMMASQNFMRLGVALSDTFTVTIPDRRGRGKSGPFGEGYGIAKECEDVAALLERTSATDVFGLSSGAIIALRAALSVPAIERVAAFEPPLSVCGFDYSHWVDRYDREVREGKLEAAMVTVMKGTGDSRLLQLVPRFLIERAFRLGMRADEKRARDGDVPIRALVPTMHFDALIVREASASFDRFATIRPSVSVLLLGGAKSASFLGVPLRALERILPNATRVELPRVGHLAADNRGQPKVVAAALRRFFTAAVVALTLALVASSARADPAPSTAPSTAASTEPSSYLEAMAEDNRPQRRGFTLELGFGGSLTYVARERADGHTGIGPTTLAVGVGVFVTPKVALLARWSGTTYFQDNARGETTQVINELGGFHLQYWANDAISLSGGPALAVVGVNPFLAADGNPQVGFGGSARVGYSLFSVKHHVLRLSWETFNSKIASAFLYGSALSFEWQYF